MSGFRQSSLPIRCWRGGIEARSPACLPAIRDGRAQLEPARRGLALRPLRHGQGQQLPARGLACRPVTTSTTRATQRSLAAVDQLTELAAKAGYSLPELAVAFVLEHPAVTSAIIGPRTMEQLTSLLKSARNPPRWRDPGPYRRDRPARDRPEHRRQRVGAPLAERAGTAPQIRPRYPRGR